MKYLSRDIIAYRKNHTLNETGRKFNISAERVRQICLSRLQKYCKVHKRLYYNSCSHCLNKSYEKLIKKLDFQSFMDEVKKQAQNTRKDDLSVFQRYCLVNRLRDQYKYSFPKIGRLLNKHHATIIHSYVKCK